MPRHTILVSVTLASVATGCSAPPTPGVTHGPFVGHVDSTSATVWARCSTPGRYTLIATSPATGADRTVHASADPDDDLCVQWTLDELEPGGSWRYEIHHAETVVDADDAYVLTAAPDPAAPSRVRIAIGSCAREGEDSSAVWDRMRAAGAEVIVLLGDTPYIDTTALTTQRRRYRRFAEVPGMRRALASTPWYAIWDDHDFGRNNSDGNLPGKERSRRAFIEYHASPSYGHDDQGIYTRFRRGPVEVFLLDTRWFVATEPSPVDSERPTKLGARQWSWLLEGLAASDAPFKIVASSVVWNDAVRPGKRDHWGRYTHERDSLFTFIGQHEIPGVVLVAGDIHRSRAIRHDTSAVAGYDIVELITSPMHGRTMHASRVDHPGQLWDRKEQNTFMLLTADSTVDPPTLRASFYDENGQVMYQWEE